MNRKLDVGSTLSQIFSTYGQQAGVLLPLAFGLFLLVAILTGLFAGSFLLSLIAIIVGVIAGTLYQGMVVSLVRDVQDGTRDSSVSQLVEETWPVVLPLIGAGILAGIGITIGTFLFIVPGLILLTIWSVIAPVIVVERSGAIDAFGRSRALVKGHGWQVFGVIVVVFLIAAVASFVFRKIGAGISDSFAMLALFSLIASTLTAPITALAASVIYFRLIALQGESAVTEPGSASDAPLPPSPA
jgi:hypothetical protein